MPEDLEILYTDGKVNVEESAFFFVGVPKWGKTELSAGWPNTIHLVTTVKEIKKLKVPYLHVNSWEKFVKAVNELCSKKYRKKYAKFKTVVVDVIDSVYESCEEYTAKEMGVKNIKDPGWGKGESRVDGEFRKYFRKLVDSRYGLVLISHLIPREITERGGTYVKYVSTLPERVRVKIINRDVSVIGACGFRSKKVVDPDTGKKKRIEERIIRFKASEEFEVGDRDGFMPDLMVIKHGPRQYHKTYNRICAYYRGEKGE